jgi:hypothetical protein
MVMLLNGDATFTRFSSSDVCYAWLIFISCGILLLMEKENGKMVIN